MAGSWVVSLRRNVLDAVDALHPRQGARVIIHTGVLGITHRVFTVCCSATNTPFGITIWRIAYI